MILGVDDSVTCRARIKTNKLRLEIDSRIVSFEMRDRRTLLLMSCLSDVYAHCLSILIAWLCKTSQRES